MPEARQWGARLCSPEPGDGQTETVLGAVNGARESQGCQTDADNAQPTGRASVLPRRTDGD